MRPVPRPAGGRPLRRYGLAAAVAVALAAGAIVAAGRPVAPPGGRPRLVVVPAGSGTSTVARILARSGLVRSALYVETLAELEGVAGRLEAGTYRFSPSQSPAAMLTALAEGKVADAKVTVVPGMTVAEVATAAARAGLGSATALERYAASAPPPDGFAPAGAVRENLEGYLYPDTYRIPLGATPAQVFTPMLAAFARAFGPAQARAARTRGLSPAQAVTLASIVTREASTERDERMVAGVFLNRLRLGMSLGSDATVYYAAGVAPGHRLTAADYGVDSPYNTYTHTGLPPGPICSPGADALSAVLDPANVPYLYFFAKPDGTIVFSRTYAGQLAAERRAGA